MTARVERASVPQSKYDRRWATTFKDDSSSDEDTRRQRQRQGLEPSPEFVKELSTNPRARKFYLDALKQQTEMERQRTSGQTSSTSPSSAKAGGDVKLHSASAAEADRKKKQQVSQFEYVWALLLTMVSTEFFRREWSKLVPIVTRWISLRQSPSAPSTGTISGDAVDLVSPIQGSEVNNVAATQRAAGAVSPHHTAVPDHFVLVAFLFAIVVAIAHVGKILRARKHAKAHGHSMFRSQALGILYGGILLLACTMVLLRVIIGLLTSASWRPGSLVPLESVAGICIAAGAVHRLSRVV
jgi:hypothetical protein